MPTNFAAIPFNNTVDGHRRQTLSSAAYSRIGARFDTKTLGLNVLGVVETDFLGYAPGNIATTTKSYGLRLRLAFADLQRNKWEILGGQSWSLLTPSRKGISPLGSTLFLTQIGSEHTTTRPFRRSPGGFEHAFWQDPSYDEFRFNGQYSWLVRHSWYVAPGQPASANLNMVYLSLRYVLPGQPPVMK